MLHLFDYFSMMKGKFGAEERGRAADCSENFPAKR
jgi:hypothetical protein